MKKTQQWFNSITDTAKMVLTPLYRGILFRYGGVGYKAFMAACNLSLLDLHRGSSFTYVNTKTDCFGDSVKILEEEYYQDNVSSWTRDVRVAEGFARTDVLGKIGIVIQGYLENPNSIILDTQYLPAAFWSGSDAGFRKEAEILIAGSLKAQIIGVIADDVAVRAIKDEFSGMRFRRWRGFEAP